METVIVHWSKKEQLDFKAEHPLAEPKNWSVTEVGLGSLFIGWFDTKKQAQTVLEKTIAQSAVYYEFQRWLDYMSEEYKLTLDEVRDAAGIHY